MAASGAANGEWSARDILRAAVGVALRAPSVLNTQPWRWRLHASTLELYRDVARQLRSLDADGRLATLSCGAALHHARVHLAAQGYEAVTRRLPDAKDRDLLARLTVAPAGGVDRHDLAMAQAIGLRHTDRRPIAWDRRITQDQLRGLVSAAQRQGTTLHHVSPTQRPFLGMAAERAQRIETADESYRRELAAWTVQRPRGGGVSFTSVVAPISRPVALRDFADGGETGLHPGFGDDTFAEYLIVATPGDDPIDWLRAGEATSAVWLTATADSLAMSAISDVVEVPGPRALLASFLAGRGHPQLVLRTGRQGQPTPPPASARRELRDVLDEDPPNDE